MSDVHRICPASHGGLLAVRARRLLQNPARILNGLLHIGETAVDIGCGPGFFTLDMAKMVGETGQVIAVDLQQGMLDMLAERAREAGLESRIRLHKCEADRIGLDEQVDFVLAFYMVHEVPDASALLGEIYSMLKPGGRLLLVEPKFHVSASEWDKTESLAQSTGFGIVSRPRVLLSRSLVLRRD